MNGQLLQAGTTTPRVYIKAITLSTGAAITSWNNTTAGLTLAYQRAGGTVTPITLASNTVGAAWASGGFVHCADGVYQLDLPIAAAATGVAQINVLASGLPADSAVVSIVVGLSPDSLTTASPTAADVSTAVWGAGSRTLSSFGTLTADVANAVWGAGTRTLTSFNTLVSDTATAVWSAVTRTLTSGGGGGLTAADVWAHSDRQLTSVSASIREAFADSFLGRAVAGGANGGRTVARALMKHVNRWSLGGTDNNTLSNYAADDVTVVGTETLTRDSNGNIIGSDPS